MKTGTRKALAVLLVTTACLAVFFLVRAFYFHADARSDSAAAETDAENAPASSTSRAPSESTQKMAKRLKDIADRADPLSNPFMSAEREEKLAATPPPTDPAALLEFDVAYAREVLNAGQSVDAVQLFEKIIERMEAVPAWRDSPLGTEARSLLATANLRMGEQENCVHHHTAESCLMPIEGSGVHTDPRGSRAAVEELTRSLTRYPEDLQSRWLLNVAYMTLGEYPDKVPERWLIPPAAFESDYDIKRFPDIAADLGLAVPALAGGAIMEDFDGDRYLDILVSSWGYRDPMNFFHNNGDGTFVDRSAETGLAGIVSGLNMIHADYDNDGDKDVYVMRGAWLRSSLLPPSLLRNNGDGTFDDVTEEAGLLSTRPTQGGAWGDYDNDGWVDLFVGAETVPGWPADPAVLYHNNQDGTFREVARDVGVAAVGYLKGAAWGDYDNDGLLDLYVTNFDAKPWNFLFHNEGSDGKGGWRFTDVSEKAGVRGGGSSFPTWFFDYDNDGWLDIFVSGYAGNTASVAADYLGIGKRKSGELPKLYHNQGDGTFRDVTHEARVDTVLVTMGCNFGDLDNDGWLDFYAGTGNPDYRTIVPNRMFRNAGGRYFQDVTTSGGFGHLQKGHGVAFGDLDQDGDQDVFLKVGGAVTGDTFQSALFENPGHGNHWITLELIGVETNRAAIGARIKVNVEEAAGPRAIYVTVTSGSSFGGSTLRQEIGLGQAKAIRSIEIDWPTSGRRQVFDAVAMDQYLEIREDDSPPRPVVLERLMLGQKRPAEEHTAHRTP